MATQTSRRWIRSSSAAPRPPALNDAGWSRATDTLAARGPSHVIVTRGAAGAVVLDLAATTSAVNTIPAPVVTASTPPAAATPSSVPSPTRFALDDDPITACRYAVDVGAFAATCAGAQPSYPTSTELAEFRQSVSRR